MAETFTTSAAVILVGGFCLSRGGLSLAPLEAGGKKTLQPSEPTQSTDVPSKLPKTPRRKNGQSLPCHSTDAQNAPCVITSGILLNSPKDATPKMLGLVRCANDLLNPKKLDEQEMQKVLLRDVSSRKQGREALAEIVKNVIKELPLLEEKFEVESPESLPTENGFLCVPLVKRKGTRKHSATVAIKVLEPCLLALNEVLVLSKVTSAGSPLLGGIEGVFRDTTNGQIYVAMPERGRSLQAELQERFALERFLSNKQLFELAITMVKAVRACHSADCVHREIALDKFVRGVGNDTKIRLVGFENAAPCTTNILYTNGGDAPEITWCRKRGTPYDRSVDIFSLGKAIGMLASKNHPSSDADFSVNWPRPAELLQLLKAMTDEDPSKRPSLKVVESALQKLLIIEENGVQDSVQQQQLNTILKRITQTKPEPRGETTAEPTAKTTDIKTDAETRTKNTRAKSRGKN